MMSVPVFTIFALFQISNKCKLLRRQSRLQQTTVMNIFSLFSEKIRLDILCESSARQRIHMKRQALFSSKDKSKKNRLLQFCLAL